MSVSLPMAPRPGLFNRIASHWPDLGLFIGFALAWAIALTLSLLTGLWLRTGLMLNTLPNLIALFCLGSALTTGPSLWLASLMSGRGGAARRFITFFVVLGLMTFCATGGLFALQYRYYFAQWHEPIGTRIWFFQFAFTSASAVYQFAVFCLTTGLTALVPLSVASLWFARRPH